jgi:hypothetical protein
MLVFRVLCGEFHDSTNNDRGGVTTRSDKQLKRNQIKMVNLRIYKAKKLERKWKKIH